jgi:hypothetical protein
VDRARRGPRARHARAPLPGARARRARAPRRRVPRRDAASRPLRVGLRAGDVAGRGF